MVSLGWLRSLADPEEGQHVRLTQTPHTDCVTPRVQRVQRALVNRDRGPRGAEVRGPRKSSLTQRAPSHNPTGHSSNKEGESWGYTTLWTIWKSSQDHVLLPIFQYGATLLLQFLTCGILSKPCMMYPLILKNHVLIVSWHIQFLLSKHIFYKVFMIMYWILIEVNVQNKNNNHF